jgi:hypothetical protein
MTKTAPEIPDFAMLPLYLTCAEVRGIFRISERQLRRYYRGDSKPDGKGGMVFTRTVLGHTRRGGTILFEKTQIQKFLAARTIRID